MLKSNVDLWKIINRRQRTKIGIYVIVRTYASMCGADSALLTRKYEAVGPISESTSVSPLNQDLVFTHPS